MSKTLPDVTDKPLPRPIGPDVMAPVLLTTLSEPRVSVMQLTDIFATVLAPLKFQAPRFVLVPRVTNPGPEIVPLKDELLFADRLKR